MPIPLLVVVCIIGAITAAFVIDVLISIGRCIIIRGSTKTRPLSASEIQM